MPFEFNLFKKLPYPLASWIRTNYTMWFISKTILNHFFVQPNEKIIKYGEDNPDKIYYILKRDCLACGLITLVADSLANIEYAAKKGYIPIIDLKNQPNIYINDNEIGIINSWDYYFEQPSEYNCDKRYTLDEAYASKNVIISHDNKWSYTQSSIYPSNYPEYYNLNNKIFKKMMMTYKKYMHVNNKTYEYADNQRNKIITDSDKVLGVSVRSGAYEYLCPKNHPIQPKINDIIAKVDQLSKKWGCNKIFITTDDIDALNEFIKVFGDMVVYSERQRFKYTLHEDQDGKYLTSEKVPHRDVSNEKYLSGLEYITDVIILSRCNCILGAPSGIILGASLMSNGFEHSYYYNCGVFGITKKSPVGELSVEKGRWILK